jgi:hypothetical protein
MKFRRDEVNIIESQQAEIDRSCMFDFKQSDEIASPSVHPHDVHFREHGFYGSKTVREAVVERTLIRNSPVQPRPVSLRAPDIVAFGEADSAQERLYLGMRKDTRLRASR